jgi:hypothetical protein
MNYMVSTYLTRPLNNYPINRFLVHTIAGIILFKELKMGHFPRNSSCTVYGGYKGSYYIICHVLADVIAHAVVNSPSSYFTTPSPLAHMNMTLTPPVKSASANMALISGILTILTITLLLLLIGVLLYRRYRASVVTDDKTTQTPGNHERKATIV